MKKYLFLAVATLLFQYGQSQVLIGMLFGDKLNQGPIEFGLNINSSISTISNLDHARRSTRIGFGLYFDYNVSPKLTLAGSLYFKSPKGAQNLQEEDLFFDLGDANISTDRDIERQLDYVELPIEAIYNFNETLGVGAGVYLAYLHGTRDVITVQAYNGEVTFIRSFTQHMTPWDFGFQFHLRYHFKGEPGPQIRFGYSVGIVDIYTSDDLEAYNNAIQFQFLIPIKMGIN